MRRKSLWRPRRRNVPVVFQAGPTTSNTFFPGKCGFRPWRVARRPTISAHLVRGEQNTDRAAGRTRQRPLRGVCPARRLDRRPARAFPRALYRASSNCHRSPRALRTHECRRKKPRWDTNPRGGFFSWLTLPESGTDARRPPPRRASRRVRRHPVFPAAPFLPDGRGGDNVRLSFQPRSYYQQTTMGSNAFRGAPCRPPVDRLELVRTAAGSLSRAQRILQVRRPKSFPELRPASPRSRGAAETFRPQVGRVFGASALAAARAARSPSAPRFLRAPAGVILSVDQRKSSWIHVHFGPPPPIAAPTPQARPSITSWAGHPRTSAVNSTLNSWVAPPGQSDRTDDADVDRATTTGNLRSGISSNASRILLRRHHCEPRRKRRHHCHPRRAAPRNAWSRLIARSKPLRPRRLFTRRGRALRSAPAGRDAERQYGQHLVHRWRGTCQRCRRAVFAPHIARVHAVIRLFRGWIFAASGSSFHPAPG